jgi:hypothetical protein
VARQLGALAAAAWLAGEQGAENDELERGQRGKAT